MFNPPTSQVTVVDLRAARLKTLAFFTCLLLAPVGLYYWGRVFPYIGFWNLWTAYLLLDALAISSLCTDKKLTTFAFLVISPPFIVYFVWNLFVIVYQIISMTLDGYKLHSWTSYNFTMTSFFSLLLLTRYFAIFSLYRNTPTTINEQEMRQYNTGLVQI